MLAIASRTVGPKLFEGTLEYPEGNIGQKMTFFSIKKIHGQRRALQLVFYKYMYVCFLITSST